MTSVFRSFTHRAPLLLTTTLFCMFLSCGRQSPVNITVEGQGNGTTLFKGNAMTMDYRIIIGSRLEVPAQDFLSNIILNTYCEVDNVCNKWNPSSELSQLNHLKKGETRVISKHLRELFSITDKIVNLTNGRFDPTIEPIQTLWKRKLAKNEIPSLEEINELVPALGWHKVHVDGDLFRKDHDATAIDLGGIAKGYAIDLLVDRIIGAGYCDVYVEWGGEIRAEGTHPEGRPWTVYISRLCDENPSHAIATLELCGSAVATSGDYLQNTTVNGVTYFHIINPLTCTPLTSSATSIASASVMTSTCAVADGLATAAMFFPSKEDAMEWFYQLRNDELGSQRSIWLFTRH